MTSTIMSFPLSRLFSRLFASKETSHDEKNSLGTIKGVYIPSLLSVFGVVMYLRLGWLIGAVGIGSILSLLTLSYLIIFITSLSIATSATNMDVKGGGAYFMISRSFGLEIGSAIGLPLFIAQSLGISFIIAGFSEALCYLYPSLDCMTVSLTVLVCVTLLVIISTKTAMKFQVMVVGAIFLGAVSLLFGKPLGEVSDMERIVHLENLPEISFWGAFALFFPAVTGIENGIALSGRLKNPKRSLPYGTISAVVSGFFVYLGLIFFLNGSVPIETLVAEPLILHKLAVVGSVVLLAIGCSMISASIGGMLGAPRTLQALAMDRIFPKFFSLEFGKQKDPWLAVGLTFVIALYGIYLGDLNTIAPILTMFFLMAYASLNLAAGLESLLSNPSWRPTFRVPWVISFFGAFLSIFGMFMISPGATFCALLLTLVVCTFTIKRKITNNWDDIRQGVLMFVLRHVAYRLGQTSISNRSWRPNFLVFTSSPSVRPYLIDFASMMTTKKGFLTVSSILPEKELVDNDSLVKRRKFASEFLKKKNIHAFVEFEHAETPLKGIEEQIGGFRFGPLSPNTVVLGDTSREENLTDFVSVIKTCRDKRKNLVLIHEESENGVESVGQKENNKIDKAATIDVWWDDTNRENSHLMVLMAYMLSNHSAWKEHRVKLRSIAPNEMAKKNRQDYFKKFMEGNRFDIDNEVLVIPEGQSSFQQSVQLFSARSPLVFIGMNFPKQEKSDSDYITYYKQHVRGIKKMKKVVYVMSSEKLGLEVDFDDQLSD